MLALASFTAMSNLVSYAFIFKRLLESNLMEYTNLIAQADSRCCKVTAKSNLVINLVPGPVVR